MNFAVGSIEMQIVTKMVRDFVRSIVSMYGSIVPEIDLIRKYNFQEVQLPGGLETPGEDSGTTACVCLMNKERVCRSWLFSSACAVRGGVVKV